MLFVDVN